MDGRAPNDEIRQAWTRVDLGSWAVEADILVGSDSEDEGGDNERGWYNEGDDEGSAAVDMVPNYDWRQDRDPNELAVEGPEATTAYDHMVEDEATGGLLRKKVEDASDYIGVAVNVGSFQLLRRTEASVAMSGTASLLGGMANGNLRRAMRWMRTQTVAIFGFSSTHLPKKEIKQVLDMIFEWTEYKCAESHGVFGRGGQQEIAGVMTCWLPRLLTSRGFKTSSGAVLAKKTVVAGRALMTHMGVVGGTTSEADFY